MLKQLGPWTPDLPPHAHEGLVSARNVYAGPIGYYPVKGWSQYTTALASKWMGGGSFVGSDGTTCLLAGTATNLYNWEGGAWVSQIGSLTASMKWSFAQFGDLVIGAYGATPVKYDIVTGTAATLGGTPPSSSMIAIVKDFVFLAGDPSANSTVTWSAINNAEGWTAGTAQSDYQQIPDGNEITGLAGGEYGLVFQRNAINRFSYVGSPLIFQRDKVSENIGCLSNNSISQAGRICFFLSERGFYKYEDGALTAIGADRVDFTFFNTYPIADIKNLMTTAIDPESAIVSWCMPNRIWNYNWIVDRWTITEIDAIGISNAFTANVSLEELDTLYPSGIDSIPISLDDARLRGGSPMFSVINNANYVGVLQSPNNLEALFEMTRTEFLPNRNTRVRKARLMSDAVSGVSLQLQLSQRLGDTFDNVVSSTIRTSGDIPIRATGRYIAPKITIEASTPWTYIQAIDITGSAGGNR